MPAAADRAEHWLNWWVASWEPTYREVRLSDLRSVRDLADIAFDSGVQLGAGEVVSVRSQELASNTSIEQRLRKETATIVEELLAGWRELDDDASPRRTSHRAPPSRRTIQRASRSCGIRPGTSTALIEAVDVETVVSPRVLGCLSMGPDIP